MNIVERHVDLERWRRVGDKVLVCGRRKVGKSFFIKNYTRWDNYFFVKRDGGIIDLKSRRELSRETLYELLLREKESIHVIDEFHRLGPDFLDFLHAYSDTLGRIRLITSTLWLSQRILSENSPILGIFQEFRMELIDERDIIRHTYKYLTGLDRVEAAVYLREPWIIPLYKPEYSVEENIAAILVEEKNTIERLVGEIFREEERELRKTYYTILAAVGSGKTRSSEISSELYSKKVIPRDDPSIIQSYITTLINIGILKRIKVFNKKYDYIVHASPLLDLYFYLDGRYGFSEIEIPGNEVARIVRERIPIHIEDFLRNLLAKIHGLKPGKIVEKDYEIDIALYTHKKLKLVAEVKWKKEVNRREVAKINNTLTQYDCEKLLITQDKTKIQGEIDPIIQTIDVENLPELIRT